MGPGRVSLPQGPWREIVHVPISIEKRGSALSPYEVLTAMEAMQEGYDGSGLGLLLRGVEFEDFKLRPNHVVLSGIAHTEAAFHRLTDWMGGQGFQVKYVHEFDRRPEMIEARDASTTWCAPTPCPRAGPV